MPKKPPQQTTPAKPVKKPPQQTTSAKPVKNKKSNFFSPEVNNAIIISLVTVAGFLLINFGIADNLLRKFRTHEIEVVAQPLDTGSVYAPSGNLHLFKDESYSMAVGEVATSVDGKVQEVEARFLIAFFLGDIPNNAEIEDVQLVLPCKLQGDVTGFPALRLKAINAGQYEPIYFDSYPSDYWTNYFSVGWRPGQELPEMLLNSCGQNNPIIILSQNDLIRAVTNGLSSSFVQFFFWYAEKPSLPNGQTDAILITELPRLLVTYVSK